MGYLLNCKNRFIFYEVNELKSIYIVLTKTNTALSRVIGVVTSDPYTHASISMDKKLDSLYTFSRLQPEKPLPAEFKRANLETDARRAICLRF